MRPCQLRVSFNRIEPRTSAARSMAKRRGNKEVGQRWVGQWRQDRRAIVAEGGSGQTEQARWKRAGRATRINSGLFESGNVHDVHFPCSKIDITHKMASLTKKFSWEKADSGNIVTPR